jgi:hypothetical protein
VRELAQRTAAATISTEGPAVSAATSAIELAAVDSAAGADGAPLAAARSDDAARIPSEFDGIAPPTPAARSAADLLSGVSGVARDQVQQQLPDPAARRGSFLDRRYDPYYDELPDRLKLIEENNPGGLRQVLSFLAKSLQEGGVTVRGGKLEAGAESLQRPVPTEAEVDAALGMLLDRWLELHDGDVRRACDQSHADMSEVVRELLCSAPTELR